MSKTLDIVTEARICIKNLLKHNKDALTKKEIQERLQNVLQTSVVATAIENLHKEDLIGKTIGNKQTETKLGIVYEGRYRSKKSVFSDPSYKNDNKKIIIQKARKDLKDKLKEAVDENYDEEVLDDIVDKVYPIK